MSTIFNVFNNMNENNRILIGEHVKDAKLSGYTSGIMAKKVEQCKPKGLSLRSKSDLNIPTNSYSTPLKKDGIKDSLFSKNDNQKQLLKVPKEFTKTELPQLNKEKVFEGNVFKEPFEIEKISREVFPEPEMLAPHFDPQQELDEINYLALDDELYHYIRNVHNDTDEGFVSDPEEITDLEISMSHIRPHFSDYEYENYGSPALPEISDDETPWLE